VNIKGFAYVSGTLACGEHFAYPGCPTAMRAGY
jgi:hypothetical protein